MTMSTDLMKMMLPPSASNCRKMLLHHSEQMSNEGYSPGLCFLPTNNPKQSVLLNATYNNYTITNHFRSKDQIDVNDKLKKNKKKLEAAHMALQRKYKAAKVLLNRTMPLLSFIDVTQLDPLIREDIIGLKSKWDTVVEHKNKRKMESEEEEDEEAHKKRKTT